MRDDRPVDDAPGTEGAPTPRPATTPVLTVDDDVLADLLLVSDGLVDGRSLVPGGQARAAGEHGSRSARVSLLLEPGDQDLAVAAGAVEVADAEGFPVVRLDDLAAHGEHLIGTVTPTGRASTGHGHHLRREAPLPAPAGDRDVIVLSRPLLDADEDLLRARTQGGAEVVLVLPLAGPSPDGLPVPVLLRSAERAAARTGAVLVGATLRRRDPASDEHLVEQVRRALGGTRLVEALPDDERWVGLLVDHRADRPAAPGAPDVENQVRADLASWWPPPARRGVVVLMSGLSGSGKSTLARALASHVDERTPRTVSLLDGDHVRRLLSSGLGFGRADRELNVLRIGYVATEVARHGGIAVCAPIAPYASTRSAVRRMVQEVGDLVLVHVSTPLEECERRDVKGLYARARAGEIPSFTGISDPYEEPLDADVVVDTSVLSPDEALGRVLDHLVAGGWLSADHAHGARDEQGAP